MRKPRGPGGPGRRRPRGASCGRRGDREADGEARAACGGAAGAHLAAVALDDRLDDPEAKAEAGRIGLAVRGAVEALEDRGALELRRARAHVLHPQLHLAALLRRADSDLAVLGGVLVRV